MLSVSQAEINNGTPLNRFNRATQTVKYHFHGVGNFVDSDSFSSCNRGEEVRSVKWCSINLKIFQSSLMCLPILFYLLLCESFAIQMIYFVYRNIEQNCEKFNSKYIVYIRWHSPLPEHIMVDWKHFHPQNILWFVLIYCLIHVSFLFCSRNSTPRIGKHPINAPRSIYFEFPSINHNLNFEFSCELWPGLFDQKCDHVLCVLHDDSCTMHHSEVKCWHMVNL